MAHRLHFKVLSLDRHRVGEGGREGKEGSVDIENGVDECTRCTGDVWCLDGREGERERESKGGRDGGMKEGRKGGDERWQADIKCAQTYDVID